MEIDWGYALWGGAIFVASFVLSLFLVTVVLVTLPRTYFLDRTMRELWVDQHPLVRILLHLLKNLMGVCLVVAGMLLSLPGIPGQGILTILIGLLLLDLPGKQDLIRRVVSRPRVLAAINNIRRRFGRPSLQLSDDT